MSTSQTLSQHAGFLCEAANYLENPSFLMRLANAAGQPVEWVAKTVLPENFLGVADSALRQTMALAARSVITTGNEAAELQEATSASWWNGLWHTLATVATGAAGGTFGLVALPLELPITTAVMFRSIASIACGHGEV